MHIHFILWIYAASVIANGIYYTLNTNRFYHLIYAKYSKRITNKTQIKIQTNIAVYGGALIAILTPIFNTLPIVRIVIQLYRKITKKQ